MLLLVPLLGLWRRLLLLLQVGMLLLQLWSALQQVDGDVELVLLLLLPLLWLLLRLLVQLMPLRLLRQRLRLLARHVRLRLTFPPAQRSRQILAAAVGRGMLGGGSSGDP